MLWEAIVKSTALALGSQMSDVGNYQRWDGERWFYEKRTVRPLEIGQFGVNVRFNGCGCQIGAVVAGGESVSAE